MENSKKMVIITVLAVLGGAIVIGGVVGAYLWHNNGQPTRNEENSRDESDISDDDSELTHPEVYGSSQNLQSDNEVCLYEVEYPQVRGMDNESVQNEINDTLEDEFMPNQNEIDDCEEDLADEAGPDGVAYSEEISYETKLNESGLLSICKDWWSYTYGAAHPISYKDCFTFDISDGSLIALDDILVSGYEEELSDLVLEGLIANYGEESIFSPDEVSVDSDTQFYLTSDALVIFYEAYEHTPGAVGIPEVSIDYSEISDLIDPSFPITI